MEITIVEVVVLTISLMSIITSILTLYFAFDGRLRMERKAKCIEEMTKERTDSLERALLKLEDDVYDIQESFSNAGISTLKVRSEDHDQSIDSIRRDLLDLQVITGTLPSRAGTMREEIENTLEALKSVRSNYLETRAVVDKMKEQMEHLAEAYSNLHFTGKEFEEMRDKLEDLSRRSA